MSKGHNGERPIAVPRDQDDSFEPELVKKSWAQVNGMDDNIIELNSAWLTVHDIQAHLLDLCGLKVSPDQVLGGNQQTMPNSSSGSKICVT